VLRHLSCDSAQQREFFHALRNLVALLLSVFLGSSLALCCVLRPIDNSWVTTSLSSSWRLQILLKRRYLSTKLYGITSQYIAMFISGVFY